MGGYREGSGRSKSGYYKGIYCGSTYELCWVIYSLDHNIQFNRFPGMIEENGLKYYPDFLLDDGKTIIETKGYEDQSSVEKKTKLAERFGFNVIVLRKNDLKFAFDYVSSKYKTNTYQTLYDDYKPTYNYVCSFCKCNFTREKNLKTSSVFCSRECSGKFRKNENQITKLNTNIKLNINRKLSKEESLEIYNRTDKSYMELANEYKISKATIGFIKKKQIYKWIHE